MEYELTLEQTKEFISFVKFILIKEGFSSIVIVADARLKENGIEELFVENPRIYLETLLIEIVNVLESISSFNYDKLISDFNDSVKGENIINSILVEYFNDGIISEFNLKDLPNYDYGEIVQDFKGILNKIKKQN
jgi:hypothetical protein